MKNVIAGVEERKTFPHLPSLVRSIQLLLDFLQGGFLARGRDHLQVGAAIEGGRLQDDLEGVPAGALAQLNHLHVPDVTQVQVHHNCCRTKQPVRRNPQHDVINTAR